MNNFITNLLLIKDQNITIEDKLDRKRPITRYIE